MADKNLKTLDPIFIKPLHYPGENLTSRFVPSLNTNISFRSLNLDNDLGLIHEWVNSAYALPFWQFNKTPGELYQFYYNVMRCGFGHSFIGLLHNDPICQLDVYQVWHDEVGEHIDVAASDCGFHLLMAPNISPISGLSFEIIKTFLRYFFSFKEATAMYGEPDILNQRSNQLLKRLGFTCLKEIKMSYKTANLYTISKTTFHETNAIH